MAETTREILQPTPTVLPPWGIKADGSAMSIPHPLKTLRELELDE